MKIIVRCPRCLKDVAIDRDDQLPLPAAPYQENKETPVDAVRFLQREIERLREQLRKQKQAAPKLEQLERENVHLRTVVGNLRDQKSPSEWESIARARQVKITALEREKYALKRQVGRANLTFDGSYVLVNGTTILPLSDIQY